VADACILEISIVVLLDIAVIWPLLLTVIIGTCVALPNVFASYKVSACSIVTAPL